MSRNSKNASRMVAARAISQTRKNGGGNGPKTEPKHGKDPSRRHYSVYSREAPKTRPGAAR